MKTLTDLSNENRKSATYTTLKEYDAAVRRSQKRIKKLSEGCEESSPTELALAKASHKFLLASRAKFKEASFADRHPATGLKPGPEQDAGRFARKPTAAEPQALVPVDRSREFVPRARVIRERSHAGAARRQKYAVDDSRAQGLGYKVNQRRAEQQRFVMSLGIRPVFPSMRYPTQRMGSASARITVNGQAW